MSRRKVRPSDLRTPYGGRSGENPDAQHGRPPLRRGYSIHEDIPEAGPFWRDHRKAQIENLRERAEREQESDE